MNKITIVIALLIVSLSCAQVGINTTNPDNSALLDVMSNDKGFLPPRLTTAERNAIVNPAMGLTIYNKSANVQCLQIYRHGTNGNGWYDICCPKAVSQLANFSAAGVLFSPNKFFAGADGTGGAVADGGEVGSIGPLDLSAFGSQYPSAGYFNKFDGTADAGFVVRQTLLANNINEYSASAFLTKNSAVFVNHGNQNVADDLRLDLSSIPSGDVYQGDFTLTVVARYNDTPVGAFNAFFAVGASSLSSGSFQLDNADPDKYRAIFRESSGNKVIDGDDGNSTQAVPVDTKFHLFNVIYQADVNGSPLVTFYIDGLLQTDTLTDRNPRIFEMIRLLNNRVGSQSLKASIAYFGLDPVVKTQAEISGLAKGIACLFDEL